MIVLFFGGEDAGVRQRKRNAVAKRGPACQRRVDFQRLIVAVDRDRRAHAGGRAAQALDAPFEFAGAARRNGDVGGTEKDARRAAAQAMRVDVQFATAEFHMAFRDGTGSATASPTKEMTKGDAGWS